MNSRKALLPLMIGAVGTIVGLVLAYYRISQTPEGLRLAVAVMLGFYLIWVLSELRITAGEAGRDTTADRGTCEAYALARLATVVTALSVDSVWSAMGPWYIAGLALFISGVALRAAAIRTLGKSYSHRVRTPEEGDLITGGPYRYLRHPAYTGMLLAHTGVVAVFFSWPLLVVFTAVFVPVMVRRILLEEQYLLGILPDYSVFAATRARLVPGLW